MRPDKEQPFYHLLAENSDSYYSAYVSQQNLLPDAENGPVSHPDVDDMFDGLTVSAIYCTLRLSINNDSYFFGVLLSTGGFAKNNLRPVVSAADYYYKYTVVCEMLRYPVYLS